MVKYKVKENLQKLIEKIQNVELKNESTIKLYSLLDEVNKNYAYIKGDFYNDIDIINLSTDLNCEENFILLELKERREKIYVRG